jgi:hypothetical protein
MDMKKALIIAGGLLFACTLQAQAQDTDPQTSAQNQSAMADSMGGQPSTTSMSGGPATPQGLTRADVYQQLLQSQKSGEAARLQDLFKGGN